MALVDYGAGRENIGSLYSNLRQAIADKGRAENLQAARDIERRGLFGTGISASDLKGMSDVGLGIAQFGQGRMDKQMASAEKSFGRRQAASERRIKTLQERYKNAVDPKSKADIMGQIQGVEMGMAENRNAFEDKMGEYSGKGIWGTGFGSDEVGWRTKDKGAVGPKSIYQTGLEKATPPTPEEDKDLRLGAMGERSFHDPDAVPDWRQAKTPMGQRSFHDPDAVPDWRRGESQQTGTGLPPMKEFERSPSQPGGGATARSSGVQDIAPLEPQRGARDPRGARRGRTGGGAEQRTPEAFQMDDIAPSSNKFSEGIMNTGRRSGPVQDNAPFETFKDAFRNARREKGAGGTFDWRGNEYTTDYK